MYKNKTKMARVVKEKAELQISYLPYGHFKFDDTLNSTLTLQPDT